jgi:hypothetical protein
MASGSRLLLSCVVLTLALLGGVATADAKAKHDSPYSYKQTFGSALRLLKVDLDAEVKEVNPKWGYLTFVYTTRESGKRKNRGSFSFVRLASDHVVQVSLQLPELPSYHEQLIMRKLRRKLVDENGEPPKHEKKPVDEDEDKDGDEGGDERLPGDEKPKKRKKSARKAKR